MISELELSYLAGLFDGEGSAGLYYINRKRSKRRKGGIIALPVLQIKMMDIEPILAFHNAFGGWMGSYPHPISKRIIYDCKVTYRVALYVAKKLITYSKNGSKREQIKKVINYYIEQDGLLDNEELFEFDPKPLTEKV